MIRRHVLAAVAAGVAAGDDDAARAALDRVDWILRGHARRRLEAALIEAALATGAYRGDDPAHVLRAAALIVRGRPCDLGSRDAIAAAYAEAAIAPPLRIPFATIAASMIVMAIGLAFGAVMFDVVTTPGPPGVYKRPTPPAATGAFRDGGKPARDVAIERVLGDELPRIVAASYAITGHSLVHETERQRRIAELRDHPAFTTHGEALATAWRGMVDSLDRWMELDSTAESTFRPASSELHAHVDAVSDQLAAAGLGYYLDPELAGERARRRGIFAYRVDDVAFVRAARDRVRVLGLRRLDHLDATLAVLGMKPEELGDPVVLLDQIDDKVTRQILPVLGGNPYELGDDGWARGRGLAAANAASGAIRRELQIALGSDVASPELAIARCRQLVTASVRHHEAQHGLDEDGHLAYPAALALYLKQEASNPFAIRARYELSAYVSQIASDVWLPQLALWNLARHAFRDARPHAEESYVAIVVIEGLARQLHIAQPPGPIVHDGLVDRDRLAALVAPIAARSTAELRSAAAALWAELFDAHLVRITDA